MGAAQSDLAGGEIVEQSSGALHLRKVELFYLSLGSFATLMRLNGAAGEFMISDRWRNIARVKRRFETVGL